MSVELLAPVGDFDCLKAAVQNGADCVYFGLDEFNARMFAQNFTRKNLKEAVLYCKLRNVKVHLTLNTLIKNSEFEQALEIAKLAYECGVDSLIVQDLGLAKQIMKLLPDFPIHASTQMTTHNLQGVLELEKLGFQRVVLARELSCEEIESICSHSNVEIECFIHGALCICYSGQCLFSSTVGGRSGNRGKCAGPCRLPYELIEKNSKTQEVHSIDKGYLLNPKDLCGIAYLPRLIRAGVKCFKIEGRMKTPEYVATVTRIYRKYIDMVLKGDPFLIDDKDVQDLMQVFNRGGFSSGHLDSKPNKQLVFKEKPNHCGIYLGNIKTYLPQKGLITLKLQAPIKIGDSVAVQKEDGKYLVSELMKKNTNLKEASTTEEVTIGRMKGNIHVGDKVYKVVSKSLMDLAHATYETQENKKVALQCKVTIKKDMPIKMQLYTTNQPELPKIYRRINIEVISETIPVNALKTPLSVERVMKQISKTNNTPYRFENVTVLLDDGLYVPSISALNELRRTALEKLEQEIERRMVRTLPQTQKTHLEEHITYIPPMEHPYISLFLRSLSLEHDYTKLDKSKIHRLYLPVKYFLRREFRTILTYFSENYEIYIYMPTITKGNYQNLILHSLEDIVRQYNIKGFVLSNIADFVFLKDYVNQYQFIGNYSLNVFNNHTIEEYSKLGMTCVTLSRELNEESLKDVMTHSNLDVEMIVYGSLPLMATNYCFLGRSNHCFPDCGSLCTKQKHHKYYLKDRIGFEFRIIPNPLQTVSLIFNSKLLSIATHNIPINYVRLDMLEETIEEMNQVIQKAYNRERLEGIEYTNGNLHKDV